MSDSRPSASLASAADAQADARLAQGQPPSPDETAPWLEAEALAFGYDGRPVLENFSLQLRPGRHYVMIGPNGAGKSTALDLLARLKRPSAGRVRLLGRDLTAYRPPELARLLALAPQSSQFSFAFTVREAVALGRRPWLGRWGRLTDDDERQVETALAQLNLTALADKPVTALSGGEAQRAVLARALAQDAQVTLFDEPTGSLDVAQALELMERVAELCRGGRLCLTVTHDLALAAVYGEEIILLKAGRLVAAGPRDAVLTARRLSEVFEAEVDVRTDDFAGGLGLSFRRRRAF
ncbi:MAG: ABC transporter ATP-binding protein [Deltaproteobacteria bacterium]|jgi:iron complex transport system ATP-binding protein|nr:ABC transporter ATP-binding protein [Deltaproteobacteria bacterium]